MFQDILAQIESYYDQLVVMLPKIGIGIAVIIVFSIVARFIRKKLVQLMSNKADDKLLVKFLDGILRSLNVIIGGLIFLTVIGFPGVAGAIFGAASLSTFVIGFAFKDIAENFLAGVIMAFNRPFRLGDTVLSEGVEGSIIAMNLRDTQIKTFDGKDVFVPNAQLLKNPLYNYTIDGFLRKSFTVGLDYDTDIDAARAVILKTVKNIPGILSEGKEPRTLISNLGSSTLNVDVQYWVDTFDKTINATETHSKAINSVLKALGNSGVNMPGDIIELKNYKGEPIQQLQKSA